MTTISINGQGQRVAFETLAGPDGFLSDDVGNSTPSRANPQVLKPLLAKAGRQGNASLKKPLGRRAYRRGPETNRLLLNDAPPNTVEGHGQPPAYLRRPGIRACNPGGKVVVAAKLVRIRQAGYSRNRLGLTGKEPGGVLRRVPNWANRPTRIEKP